MTKLDQKRRLVGEEVKKFEQAAREIHELAGTMHKKIQELHVQTMATRKRAQAVREQARSRGNEDRQTVAKAKVRKAG